MRRRKRPRARVLLAAGAREVRWSIAAALRADGHEVDSAPPRSSPPSTSISCERRLTGWHRAGRPA